MEASVRQAVIEHLREFSTADRPVYLVGGAVRDALLGRPVHDLDFALAGETRPLARELACRMNGALFVLDEERSTTRVILNSPHGRTSIDFAALRGVDIEADLRDRDFTINALAYDVVDPNRLIDPTGGLADLRGRRLRACSPTSLSDDPARVLRAVRLALAFGFRIDPGTISQMRAAAPRLTGISPERVRDELFRLLEGHQVANGLRVLDQVGALPVVLPELVDLKGVTQPPPHVLDAWEHTLAVTRHLEQLLAPLVGRYDEDTVADLTVGSAVLWLGRYRDRLEEHLRAPLVPDRSLRSLLFLAALYHDIGKPETRIETVDGRVRFLDHAGVGARKAVHRARVLSLSGAEIERLESIVRHHMRLHLLSGVHADSTERGVSRRSIYRFFKDTGPAGVDICLLSLADLRATYETGLPAPTWEAGLETCRALLEAYWERSEEVVAPPRLVSGDDLMRAFGLEPGRTIGHCLGAIIEAQAAGEVSTREEALLFARGWLEAAGIRPLKDIEEQGEG